MENKQIATDDVANSLINLCEDIGLCNEETAIGFKNSKKKDFLKSKKENSFSNFTNVIKKRQAKKDGGINNDNY